MFSFTKNVNKNLHSENFKGGQKKAFVSQVKFFQCFSCKMFPNLSVGGGVLIGHGRSIVTVICTYITLIAVVDTLY